MSLLQALEEALSEHISAIHARVIVERSRRAIGNSAQPTREDRARLLSTVRSTLRLFTSDVRAIAIAEDIERRLMASGARLDHDHRHFRIQTEEDLLAARAGARDLCLAFTSSSSEAHRMATAVSELARNIVAYTPGGQIDIDIRRGPPVHIRIVACDKGSGIAQIDDILSGKYRSKTGLGRGILGVKRMMSQFRVETGPQGTKIEAEVTFP